jgi:hypothetical protein
LGVPASPQWEGRDLLGPTPPPERTLAEEDHEGSRLASIRVGAHKLILANADNPRGLAAREVFDLERDPGEKESLDPAAAPIEQLERSLAEARTAAEKGAATSGARALDADAEAELRSLGYMK